MKRPVIPRKLCTMKRSKFDKMHKKVIKYNKTRKVIFETKSSTAKFIKQLEESQPNKTPVIPLHIYQVWDDKSNIPEPVKESIELLKKQNPEFIHHLYDNKECREFIQKNFDKEVVDAYDSVVPHAIKADLFRYCVMYKNGGIYLDSKYYCINGFKLIYLTDKEYWCRDLYQALHGIYNAILICKPNNDIMLKCIDLVVKQFNRKFYGSYGLCVSGPLMMKRFFTENQLNNLILAHEKIHLSERYILYSNHRILKYHPKYSKNPAQTSRHWPKYWKSRKFYK